MWGWGGGCLAVVLWGWTAACWRERTRWPCFFWRGGGRTTSVISARASSNHALGHCRGCCGSHSDTLDLRRIKVGWIVCHCLDHFPGRTLMLTADAATAPLGCIAGSRSNSSSSQNILPPRPFRQPRTCRCEATFSSAAAAGAARCTSTRRARSVATTTSSSPTATQKTSTRLSARPGATASWPGQQAAKMTRSKRD